MIEKLINEHGSSAILKERLELFNDKYEALETKLRNATKENELLIKENEQLTTQIQALEKQLTQNTPVDEGLSEEQASILRILFGASDGTPEEYIAHQMSMEIGVVKYHLNVLLEKDLTSFPS